MLLTASIRGAHAPYASTLCRLQQSLDRKFGLVVGDCARAVIDTPCCIFEFARSKLRTVVREHEPACSGALRHFAGLDRGQMAANRSGFSRESERRFAEK